MTLTAIGVKLKAATGRSLKQLRDVFQSFWHHFEFADLGWTKGTFEDAEEFLMACARAENVAFSTASEAAGDLIQRGL